MKKLDGLQVLRGLAATLVVIGHYSGTAVAKGFAPAGWADNPTALGAAGVDIFFVISGFVMEFTILSKAGGYRPADFLLRRAIRILPLVWAVTWMAVIAYAFIGNGPSLRITPWRVLTSLFLMPDGDSAMGPDAFVVGMTWTLTYEAYFYCLFAMALHLKPYQRLGALAVVFLTSIAIGSVVQPENPLAQMISDPILLEFLGGCLLASLWRTGRTIPVPLAALVFVLACIFFYALDRQGVLTPRILVWGIPACFIVASVLLARRTGLPLFLKPVASLGDISYSLYLWHFFVVAIFQRLVTRFALLNESSPWLLAALFAFLATGVAAISYRLIELPSRRYLTRWLVGSRSAAPVPAT